MKIDESNSLRLSDYLIYYQIGYSEFNRYRLTLSTLKSYRVGGDRDEGEIEILGEFWPYVFYYYPNISS